MSGELERCRLAYGRLSHEIDQTLGKALGYPAHDPELTGGSPDEVRTGDHVPETLAAEAAGRIRELRALVGEAWHLHTYGERAPGGNETWADWERKARGLKRG